MPKKKDLPNHTRDVGFCLPICMVVFVRPGQRKSNHCSTGFATSETKQFLIGYVYDGETRSCDVSLCELNCGSLLGTRT